MRHARMRAQPGAWLLAIAIMTAGCAAPSSSPDDGSDNGANVEAVAEKGADAWRDKDYEQAMKWLQQAGLQGNARAQYAIGYMYYEGQGVERDAEKALTWFRRAANQGDERAMKAMRMLSQGISRQRAPDSDDGGPSQETDGQRRGAGATTDEAKDGAPAGDGGESNDDAGAAPTRTPDDGS